jgi:hypothetical protein
VIRPLLVHRVSDPEPAHKVRHRLFALQCPPTIGLRLLSRRVGNLQWQTTVTGIFRHVDYLVTGLATDRVPEDDIVVPAVHFTKDNGELSSITIDEQTKIEAVES